MPKSIRTILEKNPITASAPCRIDSGGTWDIKALALPLEGLRPVTVNIALDLRTTVELLPFQDGMVKVSSEGFPKEEVQAHGHLPFHTAFGLFFAAVSYFGFHGLEIRIRSDSPVKSALGGSSTALVALIWALSKADGRIGGKERTRREILHLGYHLEDAVSPGKCGIQDQAAAVYGGIHQWVWQFGNRTAPLMRQPLMKGRGRKALSKHILVGYSGKSHVSSRINRMWITDFLCGKTRSGWIEANKVVDRLAQAITEEDWVGAAAHLRAEMAIRRDITPDALIPLTQKLIDQAESEGCGARFTGAGGGGSIWALGDSHPIARVREVWTRTLGPVGGARMLECAVDPEGVRVGSGKSRRHQKIETAGESAPGGETTSGSMANAPKKSRP